MITDEERESIINEAMERTLLALPEVVGNLILNQVTLARINKEFYTKYPEFRNKKDVVTAVVEAVEGSNPTMKYEDILAKAVPIIKEQIKNTRNLNMKDVTKPQRNLPFLQVSSDHGDL